MNSPKAGFTRIELLALLTALTLFLVVTAPLLANTRPSSTRALCSNNLRLIGVAMQRWANDHVERVVWGTLPKDGGTAAGGNPGKIGIGWIEFAYLSNELSSPRILVCPQDQSTKTAEDFTSGAASFVNSGFRGNALSYTLQFDSELIRPRSVLASDRDFRCPSGTASCSRGGNGVRFISSAINDHTVMWTNGVHQGFGHLLYADGSVEVANSSELWSKLVTSDENGSLHFAPPR